MSLKVPCADWGGGKMSVVHPSGWVPPGSFSGLVHKVIYQENRSRWALVFLVIRLILALGLRGDDMEAIWQWPNGLREAMGLCKRNTT